KPFIWTTTVEDIIKKIERARVKMEQIKPRSTLPRGKKEGGLTVKLFKGHHTRSHHERARRNPIIRSGHSHAVYYSAYRDRPRIEQGHLP
ncbi:MAG: hypothetical protein ACREYE_04025, partial [Gammaproteobacteria bacterium]